MVKSNQRPSSIVNTGSSDIDINLKDSVPSFKFTDGTIVIGESI